MLFTSCFSRFDSNGSGTCVNTTLLPGSKIHKRLEFMLMFFQDHFQGHHHPNNAQPTILSKHCSAKLSANALQFIFSHMLICLPDFYSVLSKSWLFISFQHTLASPRLYSSSTIFPQLLNNLTLPNLTKPKLRSRAPNPAGASTHPS